MKRRCCQCPLLRAPGPTSVSRRKECDGEQYLVQNLCPGMGDDFGGQANDALEGEIARCVHAVCRMPVAFHARGNVSMVALIDGSGYSALAADITELVLESHLRRHPELVAVWRQYSEDQRSTPAFSFSGPNTDGEPARGWRVFYWDRDPAKRWERTFSDQFMACAFFIKRNADSFVSISR